MWLPSQVPAQAEALRRLGLTMDPAQLANPTSDVLSAVVNFSGCSAAFVSSDGLVATNHHCAVRALEYNSTPQQNLIEHGFLSPSRAQERWSGPTARVLTTLAIHDVTAAVRAALAAVGDDAARHAAFEGQQKEQVARCEKGRPNVRCQLVSFYEGLQFALIERLELRDVRLVYAPADGVGNFGGEVDNWRWPRHGGDFALFRAYVAPDGKAADHAPHNVPYRPQKFIPLASSPLRTGELVLVAGYPGRTSRLKLRRELEDVINWSYPRRLSLFEEYVAALETVGNSDAEAKLRAVSWIRGFDNYRTKHRGELEGIASSGLLDQKRLQEQRLLQRLAQSRKLAARYGWVVEQTEAAFAELATTREADAALEQEVLMPRLMSAAVRIVRMAEERSRPDAERDPDYQERNVGNLRDELQGLDRLYHRKLDETVLVLALTRVLQSPLEQRTSALGLIAGNDPTATTIRRAVERLYAGTRLSDAKVRLDLFQNKTSAELARHPDPLIQLAVRLRPLVREAELRRKRFAGKMLLLKPLYLEALLGPALATTPPDANGTLRISFGTVTPEAGKAGGRAFTTVTEMVAKHRGVPPFEVPDRVLRAAKESRKGSYVDAALGDVPLDFLSNVTITNGNSGSPTLNARGELVGLAFDGTYDSVASDWVSLPNTRSIHVDVRYLLWHLDQVERADSLLRELGVAPAK